MYIRPLSSQFVGKNKTKFLNDIGLPSNKIQTDFIEDVARFKIFRAGRRVGKSFTAAKDVMPDILMEGTRGWIVGPNYELTEKEFRYIAEFLHITKNKTGIDFKSGKATRYTHNHKAGDLYIRTAWGSEVMGKSADNPQSLVGEELDWLIMSETAQFKSADVWERYLRGTLSSRRGRAIFPTTPDSAGEWLYQLEMQSCRNPDWAVYTQPAWECEHYNKEELETIKRELESGAMSEDRYYEQYGGEWRFYTGRVYKQFRSDVHVIEPFDVPKSWDIYCGIDFGTRDATSVIYVAVSPTGELYIIDEYYGADTSTPIHVKRIKEMESKYSVRARIADYHALGTQLMMDWKSHGLACTPCKSDKNAKMTRRDRFISSLQLYPERHPYHVRESGFPSGEYPKLFIFKKKAPHLIEQIQFLRWKETARKEGSYGDTIGEDHSIDSAEYVIDYIIDKQASQKRRRDIIIPRQIPSKAFF